MQGRSPLTALTDEDTTRYAVIKRKQGIKRAVRTKRKGILPLLQ